jgi:probable F420-dependent oxidoreductase
VRFSYAESMVDPTFYIPLAQAAEEAGYDSFIVPDSIAYPEHSDATYPFNPDGTREFLDDKPFLEPFSLIPALGAVTETIRFVTFVIKLPIRHPVLVAKQVSSVAVLTGNRLGLGVGTSPWPEDYELVGVPWAARGKRMDESLVVIRGLLAGGYSEFHGDVYDVPAIKMTPTPSKPVPILIGGHGEAALRRAAYRGDGWMHGGGDPADLPGLLERLGQLRVEAGRQDEPFEVHVISLDASRNRG